MNVRAKFACIEVTKMKSGPDLMERVHLTPVVVGSEENKNWAKWTPSGRLEMTITNPALVGAFEPGAEYYLDITPAKST